MRNSCAEHTFITTQCRDIHVCRLKAFGKWKIRLSISTRSDILRRTFFGWPQVMNGIRNTTRIQLVSSATTSILSDSNQIYELFAIQPIHIPLSVVNRLSFCSIINDDRPIWRQLVEGIVAWGVQLKTKPKNSRCNSNPPYAVTAVDNHLPLSDYNNEMTHMWTRVSPPATTAVSVCDRKSVFEMKWERMHAPRTQFIARFQPK